ncbi:MAG: hypothetical protein GWO02_10465 [Gammaproteobacteria bacterium]|nr:hypothetical protein [Gammaproteobacteria bacterium]
MQYRVVHELAAMPPTIRMPWMPDPLRAARLGVACLPAGVHAELLVRGWNHLAQGQAYAEQLAPLEGKRICLEVVDAGVRCRLTVYGGELRRDPTAAPADVTIRGRFDDLLRLALRVEDPDTLFFARRLSIEGETESGLHLKNVLDALELDWDAHLEAAFGAPLARWLRRLPLPALAAAVGRGLSRRLAAVDEAEAPPSPAGARSAARARPPAR